MCIVTMGELLIDFVSLESGVSVGDASGFIKSPGGAPANVAVAIERLGYQAAFIGQVGNDDFGHFLAAVLESEGVNVTGLKFTDAARTSLAFVSLDANGERSFMFYRHPGADMLMSVDEVDFSVIDSGHIFHFGSISLIEKTSRQATLAAAQYARNRGLFISYDPNLRLPLWESESAAREGMKAGLELAHAIKVTDEELEFLTGSQDARRLWHEGLQMLIVTRGEKGASLYTPESEYHHDGFTVNTVDTTGAGDAFVAALLTGILEHQEHQTQILDYPALLRYACAAGALTTTLKGAIPALPLKIQVDAFLAQQK